jgi:hypothetical protein
MTPAITDRSERAMKYAVDGRLSKQALASLLTPDSRQAFFDACATIEESYTTACGANDPCLESGCSCEGDTCLQPLLRATTEYQSACGAVWAKIFADSEHRDGAWRQTFSEYEQP